MRYRYASAGYYLLALLALICCFPLTIEAKKKKQKYLDMVEAYSRDNNPGMRGAPIETSYYFLIVWQGNRHPDSFSWRGNGGWAMCRVEKANTVPAQQRRSPGYGDYVRKRTKMEDIHAGDTLLLSASNGKFDVPRGIGSKVKNTLFFKTGGSSWLPFPVAKISTRKGVAAP